MNTMHDAKFSSDRRYRYRLEAKLSDAGGVCVFVMLNPSRADEVRSDPTVTRCKDFAKRWGYGRLWVCNLFAFRTPHPDELKSAMDPVGSGNREEILASARSADLIVCAWGNDGAHLDRGSETMRALRSAGLSAKMRHLGMTKQNQPKHPLYLKADTKPTHFSD